MASLTDVDVGLMAEPRPLPWFMYPATTLYIANTDGGMRFLNATNFYLAKSFDTLGSENIWFVDQNALFSAHYLTHRNIKIGNLSDIKPHIFGCYGAEGREVYTEVRSNFYGLT